MEWLNYHHLLYFWTVAREGGLAPAARALHVTHSTISAQVRELEARLGQPLFQRTGRRLVPTEVGREVLRYADEIFALGREMLATVKGRPRGQPLRLRIGTTDALPKLVVRRLVAPALGLPGGVRVSFVEDDLERLLSELALHRIDLVLADAPVPSGAAVKAYSHRLGESPVALFAAPALARKVRPGFPASLDRCPMLLPLESLPVRRGLEAWFERLGVAPVVVGEFEDSALLKVFGADGLGVFPASLAVADTVEGQYRVERVGTVDAVREAWWAIAGERRIQNPGAAAILAGAGEGLEAPPAPPPAARRPRRRR